MHTYLNTTNFDLTNKIHVQGFIKNIAKFSAVFFFHYSLGSKK